jgi:molecular chaperone Hsp33
VDARCRCSRERVQMFLARFPRAELADMREPDGQVSVTCEFCSARYEFGLEEVGHGEDTPEAAAGKAGE